MFEVDVEKKDDVPSRIAIRDETHKLKGYYSIDFKKIANNTFLVKGVINSRESDKGVVRKLIESLGQTLQQYQNDKGVILKQEINLTTYVSRLKLPKILEEYGYKLKSAEPENILYTREFSKRTKPFFRNKYK
ncbi:MAG: hypothetical protein AB7V77_04505 [Candidatus Woesearchaeota archaeon]